MSVLIKDMEMPRACVFCELYDGDLYWCRGAKKEVPYSPEDNRAEFCPLVSVPEHGRLIDADELKTAFPCGESVRTECVRATIDHAPTIIPEDEVV